MDLEPLSDIVKKALEYFDSKMMMYQDLIQNQNIKLNDIDNTIMFIKNEKEEIYNYELLGYYDNNNNIWIWGWVLFGFNYKETPQCKYLLDYGLKLEPNNSTQEQVMIKGILVNSRIKIDEKVQLEINLAIYSYLIKDRVKFIYPRKRMIDNEKFVTFYYLVK